MIIPVFIALPVQQFCSEINLYFIQLVSQHQTVAIDFKHQNKILFEFKNAKNIEIIGF